MYKPRFRNNTNSDNVIIAAYILIVFGVYAIGGLIWEYTLNSWLEYLNKPTRVEWYFTGLLSIVPVTRYITIPAALATWIAINFFLV